LNRAKGLRGILSPLRLPVPPRPLRRENGRRAG
jgi:hypothetical protein